LYKDKQKKEMENDYLKYWRVVKYYVKAKYGLTQAELEMLLFLKSEGYFDKDKFKEFDALISWNVNRFDKLRRDGWIEIFRRRDGKRKALYQLSMKSKRVIDLVYKKLNGEELPMSESHNPMFKKEVSYSSKVYRNFIKQMNAFIRQQRH
jgi:DNA-binding MarR family transcriptional regulator